MNTNLIEREALKHILERRAADTRLRAHYAPTTELARPLVEEAQRLEQSLDNSFFGDLDDARS